MSLTVSKVRTTLSKLQGEYASLEKDAKETKKKLRLKKRQLIYHEQAREILKQAGLNTQKQLQDHIADIASLAMNAVFDDPYEIVIEFVERRNKTECDIYFARDGQRVHPLSASGGGTVDVASFALRIASWTMKAQKSNNVIFLDEPMKNLSPEFREKGSKMLKEVSEKLGIQFIIINHEPILTSHADRVFRVSLKKGKSVIEQE